MKLPVSLNNNSFERAGITKDCKDAVCEYIWNGFEAGATKIRVFQKGTQLQEALSLVVEDNGEGIHHDNLEETFGAFLSSLKNNSTIRIKSQTNKGKGRFSYLSFSSSATWTTIYNDNGILKKYFIRASSADKSNFDTSEPESEEKLKKTGTSVEFPLSDAHTTNQVSYIHIRQKLLEEFAWFLYLNKDKGYSLEYMGIPLDITQYINVELSKDCIENIDGHDFNINLIVWNSNVSNSSKIYYLTEQGEIVNAQNTSFNKNKVNFYHAVFVSSKYFKPDMFFPQEDDNGQLEIEPQDAQRNVVKQLKKKISVLVTNVLKSFLVEQAEARLSKMEERGNMPSFSNDKYGELRKKDFETITRELYCVEPQIFYKLNDTQEKSLLGFLNLLLSSEEREHVLMIIDQVVNLTPDQRKNFADILQRSQLQYIIEAIGTIEKRVAIIENLKMIIFDSASFANERDHIQKLMEQHFWLFGEQYHLLTADKTMKTSLEEYEIITNARTHDEMALTEKEVIQRIDLFLYTQQIQEKSSSEMLIVELKAPYVKLSLDVFNQVVRYANTIRKEPRFAATNRVWKFYTICSIVEDDVKVKYDNFKQHGQLGLVDVIGNFELYALSWDDIFQAFEARHSFLLEKLKLDYSQVSESMGMGDSTPISRAEVNDLSEKLRTIKAV